MKSLLLKSAIYFSCTFFAATLFAQSFTKLNTIDSQYTPPLNGTNVIFNGASWVDFDNDNDQDLFIAPNLLFRNDNNGTFVKLTTGIGSTQATQTGYGTSWSDYDNDGDLDLFLAGSPSFLYVNNSDGTFNEVAPQASLIYAWACAWADYDNDGFTDVVTTNPEAPFVSQTQACSLLKNDQNGAFTAITEFDFTQIQGRPYTVATWNDYDDDGDVDLFIASGAANSTTTPDYIYKNEWIETGTANLSKMNEPPISSDLQDGQTWNFIDYDNDGDLDAYLTNYYNTIPNRFYQNDNGNFTSISNALTYTGAFSLANTWGDFDNDGDLDVVTTNDFGAGRYYKNNNGTFVLQSTSFSSNGFRVSAVSADYDNDGDLDLYISGRAPGRGLFRNELSNGNHFIKFKLQGTQSNAAAIGAKITMKAIINGQEVTQRRDISAQNSFNGHNSLWVHFGMGDATVVGKLVVRWPSGIEETFTDGNIVYGADTFYTLFEGNGNPLNIDNKILASKLVISPNPSQKNIEITNKSNKIIHKIKLYSASGHKVLSHKIESRENISLDISSLTNGIYFIAIEIDSVFITKKLVLNK